MNSDIQKCNPLEHIANRHPCFGGGPNINRGRVHLPVSPRCNIQCAFCNRTRNENEQRPGVTSQLLAPEQAAALVDRALELCPEITVAGIAGPGDTLATHHAIDTFKLIQETHPELINCLSTNGLLLEQYAEELIEAGVGTITVTVNAVDPEILQYICLWIVKDGIQYKGKEGASILIEAQKRGIAKISKLGALVKINMVLIPGINDKHVEEVAKTVSELGANFINIIPLIPQYKLSHLHEPTCAELHAARQVAEKYLPVFRHCQRCRADACGIPGKLDVADQLYKYRQVPTTFSHG
ncbi:MAG: radical SAM protein [Butyricicoccus sp.]